MKGTVIKRGAKWAVVVDAGRDVDGKRLRKWHSGFDTKREAEAARIEILSRMQQGTYAPATKVTLGEWLTTWPDGRTGLAETTLAAYETDAKRVHTGIGQLRLRDLTTTRLSDFYRDLIQQGLAPKTVQNTHGVIHKALADAVGQGLLSRNVASRAELPRAQRPETETWTADELRRFLVQAESHRLYAAWMLACSTGMRRSEVLGVRWTNVDLDAGTLAVVDTVVMPVGRPILRLGETKSRRSRRLIALDARTVAVLRGHKKRQNKERLRAGEAWNDLDLVFCDELGVVVNPATFTRTTKRLAIEAAVPPLTPHSAARHTWATLALSSGVHPKVVQERLGHSSISITLDRYSHVVEGMDREAAEKVAALIQ